MTENGRVLGFLEDYNEQVCQDKKIEEIRIKTRTDSLTGIYNREFFSQEVDRILRDPSCRRSGELSALFLLDLDSFKKANDTLGHMAGDQILCESSRIMKSMIRSTDLAGRLGGDEFVLFLQNVRDISALHVCAEKISRSLRQTYGEGEKQIRISASIGIVVHTTETTFSELYQMADKALYQVKETGKNGYRIISKESGP